MSKWIGGAAIFAVALVASHAGRAMNLLSNENFDQPNVLNWNQLGTETGLAFDGSQNAIGGTASGSGLLTNPDGGATGFNTNSDYTCLARTYPSGSQWEFGARMRIASGQIATGKGSMGLVFYSSTDCAGGTNIFGDGTLAFENVFNTWTLVTKSVTVPSTALSARIYLNVYNATNGVPFKISFDGVRFGLPGTTDILFDNGFERP